MNSWVHPTYKTRYHVTNWANYDRTLVEREDITRCITHEIVHAWNSRRLSEAFSTSPLPPA